MTFTITAYTLLNTFLVLGGISGLVFGFLAFYLFWGLSGKFWGSLGMGIYAFFINYFSLGFYAAALVTWLTISVS